MLNDLGDSIVTYASRREFWDSIQQGNKPLQSRLLSRILDWAPIGYVIFGTFAWFYIKGSDKPQRVKDMADTGLLLLILICILALLNSVCLRFYYRVFALVPFLQSDIPFLEQYTSADRAIAKKLPLWGMLFGAAMAVSGLGLFCNGASLDRVVAFVVWEGGILFGVLVIGLGFDSQILPVLHKLDEGAISLGRAKRLIAIFSLSKMTHPLLMITACLAICAIPTVVMSGWTDSSPYAKSGVSFVNAFAGVMFFLCGCFAVITGLLPMWYVMPSERFSLYLASLVVSCIVGLLGGWRCGLLAAVMAGWWWSTIASVRRVTLTTALKLIGGAILGTVVGVGASILLWKMKLETVAYAPFLTSVAASFLMEGVSGSFLDLTPRPKKILKADE